MALNYYCTLQKYDLSSDIGSFLETFEVFCEGIEAKEGAKKHAFLNSLPELVKFDMQDDDHILHSMSYNELKERAVEVLSGTEQQNNAKKRLYERRQGLGESLRDYVLSLKTLGTMAYPRADDKQIKNDVLYNLLLLGLRDKTLAEKLIRDNEKVEKPSFYDSARKLFAATDDHVKKETIAQIQAKEQAHSSKLQNLKSLLFDVQREVSKLRKQQNKFYQMPAITQQLPPVRN